MTTKNVTDVTSEDLTVLHGDFNLPYKLLSVWKSHGEHTGIDVIKKYCWLKIAMWSITIFYFFTLAVALIQFYRVAAANPTSELWALIPISEAYVFTLILLFGLKRNEKKYFDQLAVDLYNFNLVVDDITVYHWDTRPSELKANLHTKLQKLALRVVELQSQGNNCVMKEAIEPMREEFDRTKKYGSKFFWFATKSIYFAEAEEALKTLKAMSAPSTQT